MSRALPQYANCWHPGLVLVLVHWLSASALENSASAAEKVASAELQEVIGKVRKALSSGKAAAARKLLRGAQKLTGKVPAAKDALVYHIAMLKTYEGRYAEAAHVLSGHLHQADPPPKGTVAPNLQSVLRLHQALILISQARGNLMAALIESDQLRIAGEAALTEMPEDNQSPRKMIRLSVNLTYWWHRAYLLRMLAVRTKDKRQRATLRHYAEQARRAYVKIAQPADRFADSISVLEGFFAVHDGNKKAALAAAKRIKWQESGDVEHLYLAALAFEVGGDIKAAAKIRERLYNVPHASHAAPIMIRWIKHDATSHGRRAKFSPRYPAGR